jgi:hypothetical protein
LGQLDPYLFRLVVTVAPFIKEWRVYVDVT